MKMYVLGFILLGLTNLSFSQNDLAYVNVNDFETQNKVEVSINNSNFINAFTTSNVPLRVQNFQKYVAAYDISEATVFSSKKDHTYTVVFNEGANSIINVYDKAGTILTSEQHFTNIRLPYSLGSTLARTYPGWSFGSIQCDVEYLSNDMPVITYKVVLKQGLKSKTVKLSA